MLEYISVCSHWLADAAIRLYWNIVCCIWNRQPETDALSCFIRTAKLSHDPFQLRFARFSSYILQKRPVCKSLSKHVCLTSTETIRLIRDRENGEERVEVGEDGDSVPIATLSPPV